MSILILLLILGQEAVLLTVRRKRPSGYAPLRLVSLVCGVEMAVWLNSFFPQPWRSSP